MESMIRHVCSYINIVRDSITKKGVPVENIGICPCGYKENNEFPAAEAFLPFQNNGEWGSGFDSHAWFHFTINVPEDMQNDETLELCIHTGESGWDAANPQLICYVDGIMRQGVDVNHKEILLGAGKSTFDVYLYGYTGPRIASTHLNVFIRTTHPQAVKYYYDLLVPRLALETMEKNTVEYREILTALSMSLRELNVLEPRGDEFIASMEAADEYLQKHLYSRKSGTDVAVICIGHTHIDIAWLWTVAQTREKAQRSFATVVELMKRYPEYKFMSSQAYLYKAVKEEAPELYNEIKRLVAEGRWEVEGAMWVEADCNLTSGESLVRQVLYGKNFFKDEFGVDSRVLWLPDVFGYSAALPQILKKSGVDWFVTSKISWNDVNTMPYDLFRWKGLDGTEINTYFLTAQDKGRTANFTKGTTYVANTTPQHIAGCYNRFQQKELSRETIITFGFGDGGGGPTTEMLEMARRQKNGIEGLPRAEMGFAGDMLKRLEKTIEGNPRLPMWQGELYLEFHRGTYTSNARNKRNNRMSEFNMLDAELLSVAAKILHCDEEYPKDRFHGLWEKILVNQFHDIIPGSSIREVYEECDVDYKEILTYLGECRQRKAGEIALRVNTEKKNIVFNPHSFTASGIIKSKGKTYFAENIPPKGYKAVNLRSAKPQITVNGRHISTPFYECDFDENMEIARLYDKKNRREVIRQGETGNQLRIFEDYPDQYDAWEIQEFSGYKYYSVKAVENTEIVSDGARTGVEIIRKHGESLIKQTVWFYENIARIDFETELDWHSKHRILRTAFPVDINTDKASFEVQFGTLERPTHKNTSWDAMKFETCGHKFTDMSEGNYGISLINDCKYGHDVHGNTMQLTLLKCPTYPNEVADEGLHKFTYSLLPHNGTLKDADTIKEAYLLNLPMFCLPVNRPGKASQDASGEAYERVLPEEWSLISTDSENLIVETVKEAERSEDIIVRMYESKNFRGTAEFTLGFPAKRVFLATMMEDAEKEICLKDGKFMLAYKPFEIITLRIER